MATFDSIPPEEESEEDIAAKFSKACDVCGKLYPHHDTTAHLLKAPETAKQGLVFLLTRIASWTNARWDQHLRERYGDKATDEIIEWIYKHEIYAPADRRTQQRERVPVPEPLLECSNCGAMNTMRTGACSGCKLSSPPRTEIVGCNGDFVARQTCACTCHAACMPCERCSSKRLPDAGTTWERACRILERRLGAPAALSSLSREELDAVRTLVYRVRLFSAALTWLEENIPSGIQLVARALVHGEAGARR